jgi:selenocysteine-specific elongation factor
LRVHGDWLVAPLEVERAEAALLAALAAYHAGHPLVEGMPAQAWRDSAAGPDALAELAEERLLRAGAVVREASTVRLPAFAAGSTDEARSGMQRLLTALEQADAEPPSVPELAKLFPALDVAASLRHLAREGRVVAVADRYYVTDALDRERLRLVDTLRQIGPATPAAIRERLGRSRKWLIPFLEWADREGVTIRDGDVRKLNLQAGA